MELTQRFWGTQGRVGFVTAGEWAGRWVFVYPDNSEEWWTVVVAPLRPPDTWGDHYIWGDNVLLDIVWGGEIGWMPWGPAEEQVEREAFGWRPLLGPHLGLLPDGRSAVERAPTLPLLVFDRRLRRTMVSTLEDPGGEQLQRIRDSKAAFDSEGHLLRMPVGATELAAIERVPGERWHPSISAVATDAERKRQRRKRWLFGVRSPSGADSRAAVDNVIRRAIEHADDRDRRNGDTRVEPDRESTIAWPVIMFDRTNAPTVAFSQAEVESLLQKKQRQNIAVAFDGRCRPLVLGVDEKAGTLVIAGKACEEGFERVARSSLVLSRRRRRFGANGMLTDGDCEMLDAVGVDELRREIIDICLRGMRR